ncbi:hypothetical protein ACF0H5_008467 [Mactra antiquata]
MACFAIFTLAVILLSTDVFCGKNDPYEPEFDYQKLVIKQLHDMEESGKNRDGEFEKRKEEMYKLLKNLKDTKATINTLKEDLEMLDAQGYRGVSTFTRWGHTECGGDAEIVYSGYMGGSYFSYTGSGSNYVCLTSEPIYNEYTASAATIGWMYGVEYMLGHGFDSHDAPCVVCRIPRNSVIMIPGTNQCNEGWKLEYRGYLASQAYNQQNKKYICLDERPQSIPNSSAKQNGAYLYLVEGRCPSLHSPPYINNYELTCAVCSFTSQD